MVLNVRGNAGYGERSGPSRRAPLTAYFRRLLAGLLEDQPDMSPFPTNLFSSQPLMLRKYDCLRHRRCGPGYFSWPTSWPQPWRSTSYLQPGNIEQHTLGMQRVLLAPTPCVQERQLHGVADLLDLAAQTADVGVKRRPAPLPSTRSSPAGMRLSIAGFGVDQQRVAGAQLARRVSLFWGQKTSAIRDQPQTTRFRLTTRA